MDNTIFKNLYRYKRIPQTEDDNCLESPSSEKLFRRAISKRVAWSLSLFTALLAVAGVFLIQHQPPSSTAPFTSIPDEQFCGVTVAEAKAAGCVYDRLAHLWLPPHCLRTHSEKYLEYDNGTSFKYWMDDQMQEEVDISLLPPGTIVYSITKEHIAHCAFTLMRTSEWMKSGGHWERKVLDPMHFDHCVKLLLNATQYHPRLNEIGASALIGFSGRCYSRIIQ